MKMLIAIMLVVSLGACAPMPGNKLFEGLTHATPIEDVKVTVTQGLLSPTIYCFPRLPRNQQVLTALLNFGIVPACATVKWNAEGDIETCDIYVMSKSLFLEHEMRHCEGYADVLY